jgi:hypothetical protein
MYLQKVNRMKDSEMSVNWSQAKLQACFFLNASLAIQIRVIDKIIEGKKRSVTSKFSWICSVRWKHFMNKSAYFIQKTSWIEIEFHKN